MQHQCRDGSETKKLVILIIHCLKPYASPLLSVAQPPVRTVYGLLPIYRYKALPIYLDFE